jgi:hypothetical protein
LYLDAFLMVTILLMGNCEKHFQVAMQKSGRMGFSILDGRLTCRGAVFSGRGVDGGRSAGRKRE